MRKPQPWPPSEATRLINNIARSKDFSIAYKIHAKVRLAERDLLMGDIFFALKNGFVHTDAEPAKQPDHFKYKMECVTPNSSRRSIGVVVIPAPVGNKLTIVTVMWLDES